LDSACRPQCRLVALDGNGTLLGDDGITVNEYTRSVLGRVQDLGIPVVMVTGRGLEKARPTLESADLRDYVITENGARVMRISDGQPISELWLPSDRAAEPIRSIKRRFKEGACSFAQLTSDGGIIEESHPWLKLDGQDLETAHRLFRSKVADLESSLTDAPRQCAKSYVTGAESSDFPATIRELQEAVGEGWSVRQIKQLLPGGVSNTCEVQSDSVNKADGVGALCKFLGISLESVWAFGDDSNDLRMLTESGWGVRMRNHTPSLENVGSDVTRLTNKEDGVAVYLEEHLLTR